MSFLRFWLPAGLLLAIQVSALPNPHPMITAPPDASHAKRAPKPQHSFDSEFLGGDGGITSYSDLGNYSYATISPSQLSVLDALDTEASAMYAIYRDAINVSLSPEQSASLAAIQGAWTATVGGDQASATRPTVKTVPEDPSIADADVAAATLGPLPETDSPSVHGITCLSQDKDLISQVHGPSTINVTACAQAAENACYDLNHTRTGAYYYDEWVYSGGKPRGASDNSNQWGCYMAYYFPSAMVHDASQPFPNVPDYETCISNVYGQMVKTCAESHNSASINVKTVPQGRSGDVGKAVDSSQIMYYLGANAVPCGNDGNGCMGP